MENLRVIRAGSHDVTDTLGGNEDKRFFKGHYIILFFFNLSSVLREKKDFQAVVTATTPV